jgi:adenosine deaminase
MPTLLVSLGTTPAIVPEAFLVPGVSFEAVHVLTTATVKEEDVAFVEAWFTGHAPGVQLTITRVAEFTDFRSEADHFTFEEILYRWYLEKTDSETGVVSQLPYVCLSGGFKTMSAAVQKAAAILGAVDVFHVLCELPLLDMPKTAAEIEAARTGNHLLWIKLGPESGWPQFRNLSSVDFPLEIVHEAGAVRSVRTMDHAFRDRLREIVERSHRIAGAWDDLAKLPFLALATWSGADLQWLSEPLDPVTDEKWVVSLPKVELHCHLGGFATHGDFLQQVRAGAACPERLPKLHDTTPPDGWPVPENPIGLESYRKLGDNNGSALLREPDCLQKHIQLLYQHLQAQNIHYAEIRCSPANYATTGRSPWQVLGEIIGHFTTCQNEASAAGEAAPLVNLIVIATRQTSGDFRTHISRHLALATTAAEHWTDSTSPRVVGVDLAGYESRETRAHYFCEDFTAAHRIGLGITIHAGENDDAEGIWSAILDLNTRRLGHSLHLADSPTLLKTVTDRRIGIEMCPYANLQILGFSLDAAVSSSARPYPLLRYLDAGVPVTINTDNIGISAATLTDNFLLLPRLCPGITRLQILQLVHNGIDQAFLPADQRAALMANPILVPI